MKTSKRVLYNPQKHGPKEEPTLSGGFRVPRGLIEVLVDAVVIWGVDNRRWREEKVSAGFLFNAVDICGLWEDVIPDFYREDGRYFRRLGDCISGAEVDIRNAKNQIYIKRLWDAHN
jgi:hypothetical protein